MTCWYMWIMVIAGWIGAVFIAPFAAVFMMELEDDGRVWYPGLWAFIGVAGYVLFCVLTMCTSIWEALVK